MAARWPSKSPATEHPTHRSPSKSLAPTEDSCWPAVTPHGFQAGRLTLSVNGERQRVDEPPDTLPTAAVNVAAMYCALARDISSGEHTTPDFDHAVRLTHLAVRLTHLIDDVVQSANTGHRLTRQDWPRQQ